MDMKNVLERKVLKVRAGTWIGLGCIIGGAFMALHAPALGAALMLIGTLLIAVSMQNDAQQVLRMNILKIRIGTWIALLFIVAGGAIAVRSVATGMMLVLFGLLTSVSMGKRPRPAEHHDDTVVK